jgi:hypothetical protein
VAKLIDLNKYIARISRCGTIIPKTECGHVMRNGKKNCHLGVLGCGLIFLNLPNKSIEKNYGTWQVIYQK